MAALRSERIFGVTAEETLRFSPEAPYHLGRRRSETHSRATLRGNHFTISQIVLIRFKFNWHPYRDCLDWGRIYSLFNLLLASRFLDPPALAPQSASALSPHSHTRSPPAGSIPESHPANLSFPNATPNPALHLRIPIPEPIPFFTSHFLHYADDLLPPRPYAQSSCG